MRYIHYAIQGDAVGNPDIGPNERTARKLTIKIVFTTYLCCG